MTALPQMLSDAGEVVRLVTAEHLLQAAGIADPRVADTAELAEFTDGADHLAAIAREAKATVSDELVRRLDRRGSWTLREAGFTIRAPSPEAGTTAYDTDRLRDALDALVDADLIDREGARAALEPIPATVPINAAELALIAEALSGEADPPDVEAARRIVDVMCARIGDTTYRQKAAGIKALLKLGGEIAEAIEDCKVPVEPPKRTAKVVREKPS